ncbi:MAG: hypothetical protein ACRDIL_17405, partial [Candidatus Limnocylindrales bacterium]
MERAGQIPHGGIRPDDLVALADRVGPFATVWIGRSGTGGWGEHADQAALPGVLSELERAGAPPPTLDAVGAALASTEPDARGVVVVADASGVLLVEELPQAPRSEVARWSPLPSLAAVLEHRQSQIRAVVVLADRIGADIVVTGPDGDEVEL